MTFITVDDTTSRCNETSSLGQPKCPPMDHTGERERGQGHPWALFQSLLKAYRVTTAGGRAVFEARSRTFSRSGSFDRRYSPTRRLSDRRVNIQAEQLARCTRGRSPTRLSRIRGFPPPLPYGVLAPASAGERGKS